MSTEIPSGPLLLLSPHLDDAVFSCTAVVDRHEPVDVVTAFTGFPDPPVRGWWDERCGFRSSAESVSRRRAEDAAAFADTPHRVHYLDLLEVQYVEARTGQDRRAVERAVTSWLRRFPAGMVFVPAAAGRRTGIVDRVRMRLGRPVPGWTQHPDHLFVRDVALDAVAQTGGTAFLYDEFPYARSDPEASQAVAAARARGWRLEPLELEIDPARKLRRMSAYASQIEALSEPDRPLDDQRSLAPRERYWRVLRATTSS